MGKVWQARLSYRGRHYTALEAFNDLNATTRNMRYHCANLLLILFETIEPYLQPSSKVP